MHNSIRIFDAIFDLMGNCVKVIILALLLMKSTIHCNSDNNLLISCDNYIHTFRTVVRGTGDEGQYVDLKLHVLDPFPENTIFKFCELHEIIELNMCGLITEELKRDQVFMNCREKMNGFSHLNSSTIKPPIFTDIVSSCDLTKLISTAITSDEEIPSIFKTLAIDISAIKSQDERPRRYCFIHSSPIVYGEETLNLESILLKLHISGLGVMMERLWVFHCGEPLPARFSTTFTWARFIEISSNHDVDIRGTSTLLLAHAFSKELNIIRKGDDQVLFLSTVDQLNFYDSVNEIFKESRYSLLDSFLERHSTCFHLLSSGCFDMIGSYYTSLPAQLVGDFFWASARYISHLPAPDNTSSIPDVGSWILSGYRPRIYIMHTSYSDMSQYVYPRSKYLPKETVDVLRHNESDFSFNCTSLIVIR